MKHSKNSSNRHLLPRHGSSSACDDDGSSLACDQYRSSTALKEMAREQSLVTQLRAVVLPALQASDERAEVVAQMFEAILDCSAKVMAALKLLRLDHGRADGAQLPVVVDDKRRVRKIFSDNGDKDDVDNAKPHRQRKRRRLADDCVTLETPVPHYDGHEWRKYGQKLINNTKHPRSYYRCTYKQEQDCRATKTVQQQQQKEDGGGPSSADDPAMYAVVYYGQHTCRPGETASTGHSVCGGDELARSDSLSQCSNILVTCTSVIVDHHRQTTTTTSLESNCKLLDMAEELTTAEVNKDELFDMAAYTPLDFDTTWEVMDAHGYGLVMFGDNC